MTGARTERTIAGVIGERAVWHPPRYVWAVLGVAALALVHQRDPVLLSGPRLALGISLVVVLIYLLYRLSEQPPAVTMCAALVLTIFAGNWSNLGLPGFPFVPDRILVAVVAMMLLLRAPGTAGRPLIRVKGVHLLLLLLILYAVGSAAAAGTLTTKEGIFDLLDRLGVVPFLMLFIAPVIFHGDRERNLLLGTLVGLGAYLSVTAIFESLGPHALVFPHYIVTSDAALPEGRANGPFASPVTEGFACFACAMAAVIACGKWRIRWQRYLAGAVAVTCIFACFVTLERGVWIATVAGSVVAALATRQGRRWVIPGAALCAVAVVGALLLSSSLSGKVSHRVADEASVFARENQTAAAFRMIADKPLLGFGWDTFSTAGLPFFRQSPDYPMNGYSTPEGPLPLHDIYLGMAVELGLVGALLWLAALVWGIGGAVVRPGPPELRPWKIGLLGIATFFIAVAFVDPLQQSFIMLLMWTWAGVAMGAQIMPSRRARTVALAPSGQYRRPRVARGLGLAGH